MEKESLGVSSYLKTIISNPVGLANPTEAFTVFYGERSIWCEYQVLVTSFSRSVMNRLYWQRRTRIQIINPVATLYYAEHVHVA